MDLERIIQELNRRFVAPLPEFYKIKSYQGSGANRVYSEESDVMSIKVKKFQF